MPVDLMQQAFDALPHFVCWKAPSLAYLGCNRAFAALAGVGHPSAIVGKTDFDLPWRDSAGRQQQVERVVLQTGRPSASLEPLASRSLRINRLPLLDGSGAISGVLCIAEELDGPPESMVEGSEAPLQVLLDTIPFPFFAKGADLRYSACNQAFEQFIGLPRARIIGKTVWDIAQPDHATVYDRADRDLLSRAMKQVYETRVTAADGGEREVIFHKDVVKDGSGQACGIVGIYVDITERKRVEALHRRLQEELQQARNLESVGRLAGGIAHDLNNFLSPILGYADLLLEDLPASSHHAGSVQEIRAAAVKARDMIGRLMVLARKHVLEKRRCDLVELVGRMERMFRGALPEDIVLELLLPPGPAPVQADALELERALMNLVINARDAMKEGGRLCIRVSVSTPDVLLEVGDTGSGMPAEVRDHLFEPFFTTKGVGEGTGLGLATVYAIVKHHGGRIGCDSEVGKGTTFRIHLPLDAASAGAAETRPEALPAQRGGATILLVEDQDDVRRMLRLALERRGYRVLDAADGEQALALAATAGPVDLLVTDVVMPGMNGKELASRLGPAMKVIFMSGHDRNVIANRGVVEEDTHFLRKPIELAELDAMVLRVLGVVS